ncbi:MAG TPA: MbnP family protein [Adhaeribacter sp.]|nr:MbnP family protein [Adhaeribacter sp.]
MKRSIHLLSFLLLGATFMTACGPDDDDVKPVVDPQVKETALELNFDSRFGAGDFALGTSYQTASNDAITFSSMGYFVSNVELVRADGTSWKEPNSYHLIQVEDQEVRENFTIKNVPAGNYTKLRYMLGVDSVRNQSLDLAVGDLKLNNHMTWMWNTGYIFVHAKGTYQQPDSIPATQIYSYDIGKNGRQRMVELPMPTSITVSTEKTAKVHIYADMKKLFGGPNVIQVKNTFHIDGTPAASAASHLVADNAATMFSVNAIH